MRRTTMGFVLLAAVTLAAQGCATKGYVQEQLDPTRARLGDVSKQVEAHDRQLGQASGEIAANRQSLEDTRGRVQALDGRMGEVAVAAGSAQRAADQAGAAAGNAQRSADQALAAARDVDERLTQKWASRGKYQTVETKSVFFDFNKADLRDEGINVLAELAQALKADPNAVVELIGFTDPRGDDRYNLRLSRDRVDAVIRQLVRKHGVDLRRIHAAGLGKEAPAAGEKPSRETMARSRRVDIKLLAPPA